MKSKIYSRSWRSRKAYWTAFSIAMGYLRLFLLEKVLGKSYYQRKIAPLNIKNAYRIKKVILELQGLFIKVGQLLSIMTNFLPDAFQKPLEGLQDQLPPRPFSEAKQRIESELKQPLYEVFDFIEETPVAAASIGQAHKARLKDGTEVIVKVQHANIEKIAKIDLEIIRRLTLLVGYFFKIKGIEYLYTQVRKMIEDELNFTQEAASMQTIRANLGADSPIIIPEIHPEFCTERVLVTSFCKGVKISNIEQLNAWGLDKKQLAEQLIHAYCLMVFRDGFYHADPHPGNILVQEDGTLVLLDFGAVAYLDKKTRDGIPKLIEAAVKNDTAAIVALLSDLGFIAEGEEAVKIAEKLIDTFRYFLQNEIQLEGLNFKNLKVNPLDSSLFKAHTEIGFRGLANTVQVPKDYVLLNRMVTLLLGICNTLDTKINPLDTVRPYLQNYLLGEKEDWVKWVTDLLQRTISNTLALPDDLRKVLKKADKGQIKLQIDGVKDSAALLYSLGQQLTFTLLTIAFITLSYSLYQNHEAVWSGYALGIGGFFLFLLFRAILQGKKLRKKL